MPQGRTYYISICEVWGEVFCDAKSDIYHVHNRIFTYIGAYIDITHSLSFFLLFISYLRYLQYVMV